jgi:hypothetical protein
MAEANDSVQLTKIRTRLHCATRTLALREAMKATKAKLQAQGLRQSQFSHRELRGRTEQYLADRREALIAEAS